MAAIIGWFLVISAVLTVAGCVISKMENSNYNNRIDEYKNRQV
jgi:hypothetical protein